MSGHSHAKTVKRTKEANAKKRGQMFSKMAKLIAVAAREGGGDPETNPALRLAIERAKNINCPKENIEKAIKRGTGELEGARLEEVFFEAYGPGGIALIIESITDNKNRTLNELKQTLPKHNGKLVQEGAVRWLFERKGVITLDLKSQNENLQDKEQLGLIAIEAGAEDIYWQNSFLNIYVKVTNLEKMKENLQKKEIKIDSASLDWVAKKKTEIGEKEKNLAEKLFEALDDLDSVQEIYSNMNLSEENQ